MRSRASLHLHSSLHKVILPHTPTCSRSLREVFVDSHNPTIRNSAYMMFGDVLKETGRSDEAIELLRRGLNENIKAAE